MESISVAFVRNVMVGRQGLTNDVLRHCFLDAGALSVTSYLATGNVSFRCESSLVQQVTQAAETALARVIGHFEPVFVRSLDTLKEIAVDLPFPREEQVYEQCITFLPDAFAWTLPLPWTSPRNDLTILAVRGHELFSVTRLIEGRPGTAGVIAERHLSQPVTTRNWRTIQRILDKMKVD